MSTPKKPAAKRGPSTVGSVAMPRSAATSPEAKRAAQEAAAVKAERDLHEKLREAYRNVHNPKPHLECRIFPLPSYCSVQSVAMRELDGQDDIQSSYWADQHAGAMEQDSAAAAAIADQREGIRISLVGVDGVQVNEDGVAFMDCDEWTSKTWRFLMQCFAELNGVPHEDLKNAVRGSLSIGTPAHHAASQGETPDDE